MKLTALTGLACLILSGGQAGATILLNEIHINPPSTSSDENIEFIELRSTTGGIEACTGLTLLIIDNQGDNVGQLEEALNLNDFATGTNGLLLLGDDYGGVPSGGPWAGFKAPATVAADPPATPPLWSGLARGDVRPNGGLTFLLVAGWTGLSSANSSLGNVDVDGDGILDWQDDSVPNGSQTTRPFTALIDSIGYPGRDGVAQRNPYTIPAADLSRRPGSPSSIAPDNISRRLSRANPATDANNAEAWYGGNLAGTEPLGTSYETAEFFGDFRGRATPGQPNLDATPTPGDFLINEVSINPPKSDGNFEFVELINVQGGAASLEGLTLLVINSNGLGNVSLPGIIHEAWDLSPYNTGSNGLLLLGNNYPEGDFPWLGYAEPETALAEPSAPAPQVPQRWSSMGNDDLGDHSNDNNGFTLLLVQGYTGTLFQDLDLNNDGTLDATPWTAIMDSVGFDQISPGTGKTYAAAKLPTSPDSEFDNVSRKLGNVTANSEDAWYAGEYASRSSYSVSFRDGPETPAFGGFRGAATPGRANYNFTPVAATIRINEMMVDPVAEPDGFSEYIELLNTSGTIGTMHGLSLIIADGREGATNGQITEVIDLSGLSTGPNGLAVLGDSYDDFLPNFSPSQSSSPLSVRDDIRGLDANDIGPNEGILVALVTGTPPAQGSNISAIAAANIVDSIGFGTSPNAAITLIAPGFTPDHVSRYPDNYDPNTPGAWFSGQLDPALGTGSSHYSSVFAGHYKGGASPGRLNHAATPESSADLLLNEININPPGVDQNTEFVEFRAFPIGAMSTNGYTLLMIDSTGDNTGTILEAWSLDGMATGSNGLLLTGAGYPATSPWVDALAPDPATWLGSPPFMRPGDIAGDNDNGAVSFALVRNFTGFAGMDVDGGIPVTGIGADDGIIDIVPPPWTQITDAVAIRLWSDESSPQAHYGRVYGGVDLSQPGYTPDNLSRHGNNTIASSTAAWYGGDILPGPAAGPSTAFDPAEQFPPSPFVGLVSAGKHNVGHVIDDTSDADKDGVVHLLEVALHMIPDMPDPHRLPQAGMIDISGTLYPTLSYTRFLGGQATGSAYTANGIRYEVETSTDLAAWSARAAIISLQPTGDEVTETAIYRPDTEYFTSALSSGATVFLRLKVTRL